MPLIKGYFGIELKSAIDIFRMSESEILGHRMTVADENDGFADKLNWV